jgi:large subunit ribosomal protein L6
MSRIGKKPVGLPAGVTAKLDQSRLTVKGPKGELHLEVHPNITVKVDDPGKQVLVARDGDEPMNRALHGLTRALINNMVTGVVTPCVKKLEIQGVGYQASLAGKNLNLSVGFANIIKLPIPAGVTCTVVDPTHLTISGCDRQAVGQFAAVVRRVRPPEPYKGKGIRYEGERVRRKSGKATAGG